MTLIDDDGTAIEECTGEPIVEAVRDRHADEPSAFETDSNDRPSVEPFCYLSYLFHST